MAQREVSPGLGPPEVEVAVTQARLFAGRNFVFDDKWRRFGVVQNVELRGHHFHFPGRQLRIGLLPAHHAAFHGSHVLGAQLLGAGVRLRMLLLVKDDLRDAGAVAQINEEQVSQVAAAVHPTHQDDVAVGIAGAQVAAVVRPL